MASKNVELIQISKDKKNKETDQLAVEVKIKFCTHVGWDGVLTMLFMMIMAGLFVYATYLYTYKFSNFRREFVGIFMTMAALFLLLVLYYIIRWEEIVGSIMDEQEEQQKILTSCFQQAKAKYNSFQIFGKPRIFEKRENIFRSSHITIRYKDYF